MKYSNPGADFPCGVETGSAGSNPVLNASSNINNFRGYSLILAGRWNPIIRILIAQDVECLRCNI